MHFGLKILFLEHVMIVFPLEEGTIDDKGMDEEGMREYLILLCQLEQVEVMMQGPMEKQDH